MNDARQSTFTPAKRRSGKWLAIAVGIGLPTLAVLLVGAWYLGRDPRGPIMTVHGIDDERVAALRQGFEERGYVHLTIYNREQVLRWSEALFGVQDPPSIASSAGHVYVRLTEARGNPSVHAFDVMTGAFLWRGPDPHNPTMDVPEAFDGPTLFATEAAIWEIRQANPIEVMVMDLEGNQVARLEIAPTEGPKDAFLHEGVLVIHTGQSWVSVNAAGEQSLLTDAPEAPDRTRLQDERCDPSPAGHSIWSCTEIDIVHREQAE